MSDLQEEESLPGLLFLSMVQQRKMPCLQGKVPLNKPKAAK
jgi:hypothetical protein